MKAKKFLCAFIVLCIMLCSLIPAYAQNGAEYIVTADIAPVFDSPDLLGTKTGELYKDTYITVTEIWRSFARAFIPSIGITGYIPLAAISPVNPPEESDITGIEVTPPAKTTYVDGLEKADFTGMEVYALHKDGSKEYISGYSIYTPELKDPGEKTVTVTYSPVNSGKTFQASFTLTVIRVPVKSLELISSPDITSYNEHELLDLKGLKVKTVYENEAENRTFTLEEILENPDFTIEGPVNNGGKLSPGEHKFKVIYKYEDIFCTFDISVRNRKLTGLKLLKLPDEMTVYSDKEIPALDGIELEASYDNGEKEIKYHYHCRAVCNPEDFVLGPGNKVDVYFEDRFVTIEFRYSEIEEAGIKLKLPQVTAFQQGSEIDLSGLQVFLYYTDNSFVEVFDYEIAPIDTSVTGKQHVVVKYKEYSDVFTITITPFFRIGDVDGNGKITANDARQALRGSVGLNQLSGLTKQAADADRDGKVTASDARLILRASVGLEELI